MIPRQYNPTIFVLFPKISPSICKITTTYPQTRWHIYTPPPYRNLHLYKAQVSIFFTPRASIFAQRLFGTCEMIAKPMTRFDSTPRKIDGGTFFRNPARAATSASGSVVPGNDDLRVSFVFCNWHAEPDGEHERQFYKRGDFRSNRRVYATIGCSIRFQKKKKKLERERGGRKEWKKRKKKERRERETEMKNRTNQILTTRVRCYQNLTSFPCMRKRFRAHKVAACNLLSVLYAPR